ILVRTRDSFPTRRSSDLAAKLRVPFFENLDDMLRDGGIDAVIVDAPTNRHLEVMTAAARSKKHIFTEKVIAPTLHEVNTILEEIRKADVRLTVSLPRLNDAYTLAIQNILERNALGQVTQVRVRLSHNGATAGWLPEHFYS